MESSAEDRVRRIQAIKQRIVAYMQKRSELLALLQMLRSQYNEIVARVKSLGVQEVNELPAVLKASEDELDALIAEREATLDNAEALTSGL
jgi:uncharacterized coiled-coil DUF342 family protein